MVRLGLFAGYLIFSPKIEASPIDPWGSIGFARGKANDRVPIWSNAKPDIRFDATFSMIHNQRNVDIVIRVLDCPSSL